MTQNRVRDVLGTKYSARYALAVRVKYTINMIVIFYDSSIKLLITINIVLNEY